MKESKWYVVFFPSFPIQSQTQAAKAKSIWRLLLPSRQQEIGMQQLVFACRYFWEKEKKTNFRFVELFMGKSSHWIEEERNKGKSSCKFVDFKLLTGNWNNLDFSIKESSQLLGKKIQLLTLFFVRKEFLISL